MQYKVIFTEPVKAEVTPNTPTWKKKMTVMIAKNTYKTTTTKTIVETTQQRPLISVKANRMLGPACR